MVSQKRSYLFQLFSLPESNSSPLVYDPTRHQDQAMNSRFAPLLLLVAIPFAAGCETSPTDRLQGRWVGERVENFAAQQVQRASGWARGATFEFRGNRVTVGIPTERPRQGTFRVTAATAEELRVSFMRPHGAKDDVTFQLGEDDVLRWMIGDGRSVVMRRVND